MSVKKFGIGQPIRRVEDQRFLTGGGRYTDDVVPEKTLVGVVLRSPHAHARFRFTDLDTARGMKGVRLVLTADDLTHLGDVPCLAPLANSDGSQSHVAHIPVLAKGVVKHVGDAVAFIVADTALNARDAAEAIGVDYETLPAAVDMRHAIEKGSPAVWPQQPNNVAVDQSMGDKAKVDAIFAKADKVVKLEIENNRLVTNYMETRGCIGEYDAKTKTYKLTASSQGVHGLRDTLANQILKVKPAKVHVVTGDVGGGFGTKSFMYREYVLAVEAARLLKRPVKWVADRSEHFVGDAQGRDNVALAEVAMDRSGKFLAMRFDILGNLGAYASQFGPYIPYLGATMMTGVYKTPAIFVRVRCVYTNTVPVDAYRGAGRPEAAYLLERLVDRAAREMGMKPDAIRRKNFIPPSAMPYTTPIADRTYDTGDFDQHMTRAMEAADWAGFKDRLRAARKDGKIRGIGLATYIECTAWGDGEDVEVRLETDGGVTIFSGTQSNGQGHATAYAQFAAQHLDLPLDRIRVVQGDTAQVKTGHGTGGSRSIPVGGVSTYVAARNLAEKLKDLASEKLEASVGDLEIVDGAVRVAGTDRRITFQEIANLPGATQEARTGQGEFVPPNATYPNGTHIAEVEIDPETGVTRIVRYTICDDFGIAVNPLLLAGQVHGGVAQGIGQALLERTVYDDDGQLVTASFMDYCMPRAGDLPSFHFETKNVPSTTNPLGIKGAGEAGSIGSCPAVMNAMVDALDRAYGARDLDMPATPDRVFAAIRAARTIAA
ncbi:xanthine dehydrogenase family protein molybdopterin-binding subunit [Alsobacter sp. SYSU M60028]|uniref:Xanthine dehydrogenase family protein molybdopterin-binding subunit n=1 Tax=Alsobacter ponti TaxID=2962936 RepID=A0ABT1L8J5_9HYPH|nr:xanthine dehydrogenase family protein molybdopterin-binding subunit [Alsobacter ponti]MCP8937281.1 xanthine dehydrogenase family protein molybdopterin-binding subunit [Alsobacter ponti]